MGDRLVGRPSYSLSRYVKANQDAGLIINHHHKPIPTGLENTMGKQFVDAKHYDGNGLLIVDCEYCDGNGEVFMGCDGLTYECSNCEGVGYTTIDTQDPWGEY